MSSIPPWITAVVLCTDLLLATAVVVGTRRAAARAGLSATAGRRLAAGVAVVLVAWFAGAAVVVTASFSPLDAPVLGLIGGPVVVGVAALASPTWRRVVRATPQAWLVGVQTYRVVGVVFLAVWAAGDLPAFFALPAGIGDLLTGAGAVAVAALLVGGHPRARAATVGWNAFGLADLVVAVGAGSTLLAGVLSTVLAAETSTAAVVAVPLGLIPTFLVPISVTLHCYSLSNLAADRADRAAGVGSAVATDGGSSRS